MIYECDQCSKALPPGVTACPNCGETFEDVVPADAEVPRRGFSAAGPSPKDTPTPKDAPTPSAPLSVAPPLQHDPDNATRGNNATHGSGYDWLDAPTTRPARNQQKAARGTGRMVGLIVVLCAGWVIYNAVRGGDLSSSTPTDVAAATAAVVSQTHTVTYKVTGTAASASLTYANGTGGTEQVSGASVPWSKSFSADGGAMLYLSAQNQNQTGNLTVEIDVDGSPRKSANASGGYSIADVNGTL